MNGETLKKGKKMLMKVVSTNKENGKN